MLILEFDYIENASADRYVDTRKSERVRVGKLAYTSAQIRIRCDTQTEGLVRWWKCIIVKCICEALG